MKRQFVTTSIGAVGLVALLLVPLQSCTNLDEVPTSAITPGNFFRTQAEVLAGLAGVYAQLRGTIDDYYDVSEISTDEMVVPTRGQDWYDNGVWREIHDQLWTPTSPSGLSQINGAWNTLFGGVARANVLLDALKTTSVPNQATIVAEAQALRAFYYYLLQDLFGGVPIATTSEVKQRARVSRDSTFRFIQAELLAARSGLPVSWDAGNSGRFTKGAVDAILASLYLNAAVFKKDGAAGGINPTAYNSCLGVQIGAVNACQAASDRADSILNSSYGYALADSFPQSFRAGNGTSKENIFVVKFIAADGLGLNFVMRALHYSQFNPSPWNGFATLAETYRAFDATDLRRNVILKGSQVNVLTGAPVNDRAGNPLVFTDTIHDLYAATEGEGARIYKWPADPNHVAQNNGNDVALFRLAEIYLIKAEAQFELGNAAVALSLLNTVRARKAPVNTPLVGPVTHDLILRERLFELIGEGKRREDLIRFGNYTPRADAVSPTNSWMLHGKVASAPYYVLMPVPQTQIDANPLLTQNPGY